MSNVMTVNGRARKTLADQIDRLDRVLDGLAEGLNEAVAMEVQRAVGRAVREAVQAAIREVLTNPDLAAKLRPPSPPGPAPAVGGGRLRMVLGRAAGWALAICRGLRRWADVTVEACASAAADARTAAAVRVGRACDAAGRCWDRVKNVRLVWPQLVRALAVGLTLAALALVAGPYLASAFSGGGGFAAALAAQLGRPASRHRRE
jgi:hypothetical protein